MVPFVLVFLVGLAIGGLFGHSLTRRRFCVMDVIAPDRPCPFEPRLVGGRPKLTLVRSEQSEAPQ